jgi:hydrophobic/amphiphilic exporter-1 (mainly G- bacteria), HAE1 family
MTSFAFILSVLPLVIATGAGANARRSLGISVFTGMIASTCLAVVFVPAFFVALQRLDERRRVRGSHQMELQKPIRRKRSITIRLQPPSSLLKNSGFG